MVLKEQWHMCPDPEDDPPTGGGKDGGDDE